MTRDTPSGFRNCPPDVSVSIDEGSRIAPTAVVMGAGTLSISKWVTIEENVVIDLGNSRRGRVRLDSRVKLKVGCVLRCYNGSISIGHRSTVGEYTVVAGHGGIAIGAHVGIAPHCTITASNHILGSEQTPFRYRGETAHGITIEDDVWIAAGVRVLDGVRIETGVAVGAGSVVTKSMPARTVCIGVPCRPVRSVATSPSDPHLVARPIT